MDWKNCPHLAGVSRCNHPKGPRVNGCRVAKGHDCPWPEDSAPPSPPCEALGCDEPRMNFRRFCVDHTNKWNGGERFPLKSDTPPVEPSTAEVSSNVGLRPRLTCAVLECSKPRMDGSSLCAEHYRLHERGELFAPSEPPTMAEGKKYDNGKLRFDLLPPDALAGVVSILNYGATKYGDRNWEAGINYGRVFAAAMRHLWAWWKGEECDQESGLHHLDHAMCCIMFLSAYSKRGMVKHDDRPKEIKS